MGRGGSRIFEVKCGYYLQARMLRNALMKLASIINMDKINVRNAEAQ